ncbi:MAG TPA: diguanylate cyclase [Thermoanaerobaculia bacterium]|nr:diguanylate cyclase [Thermoanaerobaculia bacterium]
MPSERERRRSDSDARNASLRLLVVEDDPGYRAYLSAIASRFGFFTACASNGEEGLTLLRGAEVFDLAIIDYQMPGLDGLDVIRAIRADDRIGDLYTMMLTAHEDAGTRVLALELGYDDFLGKSSTELEIAAKLSAARRIVARQRRLDAAVRELYGLANRDELTGLYNRRYFFSEADRMLAEEQAVNVVLLDLDDFKTVNDTYGHLAGDRILRDLGALLIRRTRRNDVIARYGGDEFVLLVPRLTPSEVEAVAERLAGDIRGGVWTFDQTTFSISVTTGIACSTLLAPPATVSALLSTCDRDLYKNKWLRKHPGTEPSLYEYDEQRAGRLLEMLRYRASDDRDEPGRPVLS